MKKFWKILLIVVLVLGIIAGGTAIVLKNMDEDKLIILESKVCPIQEGDKLEGYVFHVDAIKEMTEEDLEELIDGVDCKEIVSEGFRYKYYNLIKLDCDTCDPYDDLNPINTGCGLSVNVIKIQSTDEDANKLNGMYGFCLCLGHEFYVYGVGEKDGEKIEINCFTKNEEGLLTLDAKGEDDYIFKFNELDWHVEELKFHNVISVNNVFKLMKYIGGVFADE